jgi:hypothetical protein
MFCNKCSFMGKKNTDTLCPPLWENCSSLLEFILILIFQIINIYEWLNNSKMKERSKDKVTWRVILYISNFQCVLCYKHHNMCNSFKRISITLKILNDSTKSPWISQGVSQPNKFSPWVVVVHKVTVTDCRWFWKKKGVRKGLTRRIAFHHLKIDARTIATFWLWEGRGNVCWGRLLGDVEGGWGDLGAGRSW